MARIDANILTENEDSIVNILSFRKLNSENSFNKSNAKRVNRVYSIN